MSNKIKGQCHWGGMVHYWIGGTLTRATTGTSEIDFAATFFMKEGKREKIVGGVELEGWKPDGLAEVENSKKRILPAIRGGTKSDSVGLDIP